MKRPPTLRERIAELSREARALHDEDMAQRCRGRTAWLCVEFAESLEQILAESARDEALQARINAAYRRMRDASDRRDADGCDEAEIEIARAEEAARDVCGE